MFGVGILYSISFVLFKFFFGSHKCLDFMLNRIFLLWYKQRRAYVLLARAYQAI